MANITKKLKSHAIKLVIYILFFSGPLLTTIDVFTDIYYTFKTNYYSRDLEIGITFFAFLYPGVMQILSILFSILLCINSFYKLALVFLLIGPILFQFYELVFIFYGLIGIFGTTYSYQDVSRQKVMMKFLRFESLFQSLPQLVLQGLNNSLLDEWTVVAKLSYTLSVLSFLHGIYVITSFWQGKEKFQGISELMQRCEELCKEYITELQQYCIAIIYEKFDNIKVSYQAKPDFKTWIELNADKLKEIHERIEILKDQFAKLKLRKASDLKNRMKKKFQIIIVSQALVSIVGLCLNIYYVLNSNFYRTGLPYICLGFFLLYAMLSFIEKVDDRYRKFVFLKLFMGNYYLDFLENVFELKTKRYVVLEVLVEFFVLVLYLGPLLAVFIINNNQTDSWGILNIVTIAIDVANALFVIVRIIHLFVLICRSGGSKVPKKGKVEPILDSSGN